MIVEDSRRWFARCSNTPSRAIPGWRFWRDGRQRRRGCAGRCWERVSPDVIGAMDIRLPGMDGLEATRRIMSNNPIPIVVVAASIESKEVEHHRH